MSIYLVSWEINEDNLPVYQTKRSDLIGRLSDMKGISDPDFDSVYFIKSDLEPKEIYERLHTGLLDMNDRLIVSAVTTWWANLSQPVDNWMKSLSKIS